jgi:hypothetical protein
MLKSMTKNTRKITLPLIVGMILVIGGIAIISFLPSASVLRTGSGKLPEVSIEHISTFDVIDRYYVTFNVTMEDPDNDIVQAHVEIKTGNASIIVETDTSGVELTTEDWVQVWSGGEEYSMEVQPVLNPFSGAVNVHFFEDVPFKARIVVGDLGGNIIFEETNSNVIKKQSSSIPSFELIPTVFLLIVVITLLPREVKEKK